MIAEMNGNELYRMNTRWINSEKTWNEVSETCVIFLRKNDATTMFVFCLCGICYVEQCFCQTRLFELVVSSVTRLYTTTESKHYSVADCILARIECNWKVAAWRCQSVTSNLVSWYHRRNCVWALQKLRASFSANTPTNTNTKQSLSRAFCS